jgi:hypothetical protein
MTIIDGGELFQAFTDPSSESAPQFRHSREPQELKFYSTVFEQLWDRGRPT